jgi:predicted ATP-dependent endonuclease of OLD family
MAHITEFVITGLAGKDKPYSQKLDRNINVFYGLNGSGKTSLLRIFNSAMSNDATLLTNVPFKKAEVKIYSIDYKQIFTYTLEKTFNKTRDDIKAPLPAGENPDIRLLSSEFFSPSSKRLSLSLQDKGNRWKIKPIYDDFGGHWRHRYLPTSRLYISPSYFLRGINEPEKGLSEEQLDEIYSEAIQYLWREYYSNLITAVNQTTQDGLVNILKALLIVGARSKKVQPPMDVKIAYMRISNFLKRQGATKILGSLSKFEQSYKNNPQLQSVLADIDKTEEKITNIMSPRNQLEFLISRMFSGNKTVSFGPKSIEIITKQKEPIGVGALSSGEKHILRIFIDTLLASECSFIVDEPEISMHVDWQKELIGIMHDLNPSLQFIFATHSPEIMANINDSQIFRL